MISGRFAAKVASVAVAVLVAAACGSTAATPAPTGPASPSESETPSQTFAGATAAPSPSATPTPLPPASESPAAAGGIPEFRHIYLIIMENKEYRSIVGSKSATYINSLIARYGLVTGEHAVAHPSEPNYIALTSGGLNGVRTDGHYDLKIPNLFDQIEAAGKTWHVYAQDYPGGCFTGSVFSGAADGPGSAGEYVRKHNPAISYYSISHAPSRCANITHLAGFDPAAADFEMIVPNLINDMHSSSVRAGDNFLRAFLPQIVGSSAFADSVVLITWDEGGTSYGGGGRIATIAISPGMTPGARYAAPADHYSLLRTIEDAWRMPPLGLAAAAKPLSFPY
jgi:acid phosphatase